MAQCLLMYVLGNRTTQSKQDETHFYIVCNRVVETKIRWPICLFVGWLVCLFVCDNNIGCVPMLLDHATIRTIAQMRASFTEETQSGDQLVEPPGPNSRNGWKEFDKNMGLGSLGTANCNPSTESTV